VEEEEEDEDVKEQGVESVVVSENVFRVLQKEHMRFANSV